MNRQAQNFASDLFDSLLKPAGLRWNHRVYQTPDDNRVPVNISEDEQGYAIEVVAPGLSKDDIQLNIEDQILTVSHDATASHGEDKTDRKPLKTEYIRSSFKRSFRINDKIDSEKIAAKYEAGILRIDLPKKEVVAASNKTIAIH